MSGTVQAATAVPLWITISLPFATSAIAGGLAFWAATRSAAARYASKQLASADKKSDSDKKLSIALFPRDERGLKPWTELVLINLCSDIIFINGVAHKDWTWLDIETRSGGTIKFALKPGEETVILRLSELEGVDVDSNPKKFLDVKIDEQFKLFISMHTDPGYKHIEQMNLENRMFRRSGGDRISTAEYEDLTKNFISE